eukprot:gene4341-4918_t
MKQADPSVKIFFRPKSKPVGNEENEDQDSDDNLDFEDDEIDDDFEVRINASSFKSLLFVHQTEWQRRLLSRYGNELVLLDATYRTTRYAIPLFFLVVKTNVDYQVVGTFVCEGESTDNIVEALTILREWNPGFQPKYCMTDYSNEEIRATEEVFPGCFTFICDFHREQAWERWLRKTSNGCTNIRTEVLHMLRRIARAHTAAELKDAEDCLRTSEIWKDQRYTKLVIYLQSYWFNIKKRWIQVYRQDRLLVNCNTNNGVERQNESLKYQYIERNSKAPLTRMLTILTEQFLVDKYEKYCDANIKMSSSYRRYAENIPRYLINRPSTLVKSCLEKIDLANKIPASHVRMIGMGSFVVASNSRCSLPEEYNVSFGDEETMPSCTCYDWRHSAYPCKHFFAVFQKFPVWSWEALSPQYRNSPFLTLDEVVVYNQIVQHNNDGSNIESQLPDENITTAINVEDHSDIEFPNTPPVLKARPYGKVCRETMNEIRNLTFLIDDQSVVMSECCKELTAIKSKMYSACPEEKGLPLLQAMMKKVKIGVKKEKAEAARIIDIGHKNKTVPVVTEEVLVDDAAAYGTDRFNIDVEDISTKMHFQEYEHPENCNVQEGALCEEMRPLEERFDSVKSPFQDLSRSDLNKTDMKVFEKNEMLNDKIINVFQRMLAKDIPEASGLQDTVLGQRLHFKPMPSMPFVQIVHDGKLHWVVLTTYGCQEGEILLLDSLFSGNINQAVKQQICHLMKCQHDIIKVKVAPVQQQKNSFDCGVFSIAFMHSTVVGENISTISYDQVKMRSTLLQSLLRNTVLPFPPAPYKVKRCRPKTIEIPIFCSCRQLWLKAHANMVANNEDQILSTSSNNSSESESGDAILSILLNNPEELELQHRPSGIRRNLVFTLNKRVVSIASAKSDDNGACLTKATVRKQYYYNNDVNVLECKTVHQSSNGSYYHNVREARGYKAQFVPKNNVYEVVRCYRQNKSNPAFNQTIATARKMNEEEIMPYYLVTYKWSDGIDHSAKFKMPRHGNARKPDTCPYYRQDPDVLQEIDSMLDKGHLTDKIYTTLANRATSTFSFKDIVRSARNLWCTQHLENRDVEKLRALGCNQRVISRIMSDIYGTQNEVLLENGLADADDEEDFEVKMESLKPIWEDSAPGFSTWFEKRRSSIFKECLIQSARRELGINGRFTSNGLELKHKLQKKHLSDEVPKEVASVSESLKEWAEEHFFAEYIRAIRGLGKYRLAPDYRQFYVDPVQWNRWSVNRQEQHLSAFYEFVPRSYNQYQKPKSAGLNASATGAQKRRARLPELELFHDRVPVLHENDGDDVPQGQVISKKRQEVPSFIDPDRQQSGEYQLVHRDDTKSCPKSVSRCQQCHIAFQSSDVVLIKTTGVREKTTKDGKQK